MDNIAQQLMHQLTAPRAWFPLLLPLFLFLVICYTYNALHSGKKQQRLDDHRLPPSPPGLPLVGHLHLIGSLPHVSLRCLTTKHGVDLMLLHLGAMPVLVISSPGAAEAVLRTHDHVFASRPNSLAAEVMLYGSSDIAFASYGDTWRKARMLITTHLLTMRRVQLFRHSREEEVSVAMGLAMEAATTGMVVDVGKLMKSCLHDLICRSVMGVIVWRWSEPAALGAHCGHVTPLWRLQHGGLLPVPGPLRCAQQGGPPQEVEEEVGQAAGQADR